ncbi:MAG: hypothetical protein RR137_10920 [Odoribacter sp.]
MKDLKNIEFSLNPSGTISYTVDGGTKIYAVNDYELTASAMAWLELNYPEAVKILAKKFSSSQTNRPFHHWQIVTNFFACKCGACDNVLDIDDDGIIHSEFVICPVRFFCKDKTCQVQPKYRLTPAESEIMPLLSDGLSHNSIATILKKNPESVKSTIKRACKRFGIEMNGKKLVAFCLKNNLL